MLDNFEDGFREMGSVQNWVSQKVFLRKWRIKIELSLIIAIMQRKDVSVNS